MGVLHILLVVVVLVKGVKESQLLGKRISLEFDNDNIDSSEIRANFAKLHEMMLIVVFFHEQTHPPMLSKGEAMLLKDFFYCPCKLCECGEHLCSSMSHTQPHYQLQKFNSKNLVLHI